jgi:hypothetical protein
MVIRGGVESVFYPSHLGGFAGGGAEKTPAGDYSMNTTTLQISGKPVDL